MQLTLPFHYFDQPLCGATLNNATTTCKKAEKLQFIWLKTVFLELCEIHAPTTLTRGKSVLSLRILSPRHIEIIKGAIWQNPVLTFLHLVEAFQKLNERSQNRLDETGTFEVINDFYLLTYSIQFCNVQQ